jgi:hypothetical protein
MCKVRFVAILSLIASAALATDAQAAVVTVGSPLLGSFISTNYGGTGATYANLSIDEPGGNSAASPVDGTIVSWSEVDAEGPALRLSVLRRAGGTSYGAVAKSAPQSISSLAENTFPTDLAIKKGDLVGIDIGAGDHLGLIASFTGVLGYWEPLIEEGSPASVKQSTEGLEVGVSAQVQPAPTIGGLSTTAGPPGGGTVVTITGTDFEGAGAVAFGSTPAASFTVDSEAQITAVAPAGAVGPVNVSVTTIAGTATSGQAFVYQLPAAPPAPTPAVAHCVVPRLTGKKLKASKKKIRAADCKVGKVTKRKGAKVRTGKVVGQGRKPGAILPAGTVVKVTLGKG